MFIKRILYSKYSSLILSVILGFGLATLFRMGCKGNNCNIFKAPEDLKDENKIYKINDKCYKAVATPIDCDNNKKTLEFFA
ncbi:MAG: hypothetical protein CMF80_07080 [Candidatus Marinimicrobia bacterium]|nr:hypothetical protein [Candidatus Neomarinimicrobiota bacterium]|tara:strand:- start:919 stop:1161 length:243 start_codon:yes stop_codon:yes gene_type:complete